MISVSGIEAFGVPKRRVGKAPLHVMRRSGQEAGPRGSETRAQEWLERVASDVRYVGEGEGPPDFVVDFHGNEVAVEVMRMLDGEGWPREQRVAFERELEAVVDSVKNERGAPRWHVHCEYDPSERRPPKPKGEWAERVLNALRRPGAGGEIQLLPDTSRVGRGVVVEYLSASNDGSFSGVNEDTGIFVAGTASARIASCVGQKAQKVRKGTRARSYSRWWLLLEDEVVIVHNALGDEWSIMEDSVRCCEGIDQWSKVVLLSRYTGESTALYERSSELPLARHGHAW